MVPAMLNNALISGIAARLEARAGEMVELLRRLVEIESPSDNFEAISVFSHALAVEMERLGLRPKHVAVRGGPDLLECLHGSGDRPIMLLGHMDTVWPMGTLKHRPVRIEGQRFYGPGSYDMKAGIVVALYAATALGDACPRVLLFMTPQEEVSGGDTYRGLLEQRAQACSAVLGLEPAWPGGAVKTERKGCGRIVIRTFGRAAHAGAEPERGINAIVEMSRQIDRLVAIQREAEDGVTYNVGVIRGGSRSNVVPESAEVEVDVRFRTLASGRKALERVRVLSPVLPGARVEVTAELSAPPLERTPAVMRLYEIAAQVEAVLGGKLEHVSTGGVGEVCYAAACGTPAIDGLGADGGGAHAEDEHVLLPSLPRRAALVAGMLLALREQSVVG